MKIANVAACLIVAAPLFTLDGLAADDQAPAVPPAPTIHVVTDQPLGGSDTLHVVTANIDWPGYASTGRHTHPGDEIAYVLQGQIEVTADGQAPHIYKSGEFYHNMRGVIHTTRNVGRRPAITLAVIVVDKGVPLTQPVK